MAIFPILNGPSKGSQLGGGGIHLPVGSLFFLGDGIHVSTGVMEYLP